jgi:hypothetical protein
VTVGETLTEARYQAGLSVDELSERTRIRGVVIRSIEQDDYAACGGDLYVRGYVRAIAGAVGIDAQPLIREYDLGRTERANGSGGQPANGFASAAVPNAALTAFDLPAVTGNPVGHDAPAPTPVPTPSPSPADMNATRFDMPTVRHDAAVTSYDLPLVPETSSGTDSPAAPEDDLMAAGYDLKPAAEPGAAGSAGSATMVIPALGPDPAGPQATAAWPAPGQGGAGEPGSAPARTARKRRRGLYALGTLVVLVVAGVLGIHFATGSTATKNTAAVSVPSPNAAARASASAQASASAASARASASAQASASAAAQARQAASARAAAQRVTSLPVAGVMAFGPGGYGDGDDPSSANNAIARHASQPWSTQWYDTSTFGMLKHGTGLLLDLGGKVTVTSVSLDVSQYQGGDLQLRVGNGATLADLKVAATANNVSGTVKLTLRHPVAARYLLIWFTQLAPNASGQYQETVSHVALTGRR